MYVLWKSPLDITLLNTVTARWINVKGHRSWIHCDISCPPDAAFHVNIVQPSGVRTTNSTSRLVEPDRGLAHYEGSRWFWGHHLSRNWPARFLSCFEHPQRVRRYGLSWDKLTKVSFSHSCWVSTGTFPQSFTLSLQSASQVQEVSIETYNGDSILYQWGVH